MERWFSRSLGAPAETQLLGPHPLRIGPGHLGGMEPAFLTRTQGWWWHLQVSLGHSYPEVSFTFVTCPCQLGSGSLLHHPCPAPPRASCFLGGQLVNSTLSRLLAFLFPGHCGPFVHEQVFSDIVESSSERWSIGASRPLPPRVESCIVYIVKCSEVVQ